MVWDAPQTELQKLSFLSHRDVGVAVAFAALICGAPIVVLDIYVHDAVQNNLSGGNHFVELLSVVVHRSPRYGSALKAAIAARILARSRASKSA
jgi:hypothetical protein